MDVQFVRDIHSEKDIESGSDILGSQAVPDPSDLAEFVQRLQSVQWALQHQRCLTFHLSSRAWIGLCLGGVQLRRDFHCPYCGSPWPCMHSHDMLLPMASWMLCDTHLVVFLQVELPTCE